VTSIARNGIRGYCRRETRDIVPPDNHRGIGFWDKLTAIGTAAAAVFAGVAVLFSSCASEHSRDDQAQAGALGALQEHLKLSAEHPELASREYLAGRYNNEEQKQNDLKPEYAYFASHAIFTAETIENLTNRLPDEQQTSWNNTITGLVHQHDSFILAPKEFPCTQYDPDFIREHIKKHERFANENVCPDV
jgi:hypothetical protein